jgi:hypothetical protein
MICPSEKIDRFAEDRPGSPRRRGRFVHFESEGREIKMEIEKMRPVSALCR